VSLLGVAVVPDMRSPTPSREWDYCSCDRTYHDECPDHGTRGSGLGPSGKKSSPSSSRSLASTPFWLDGGYDFDAVQACKYHPDHRWITVRLGDVLKEGAMRDPDEEMTICQGCYAPRCGYTTDADRCTLWRHHATNHRYESGRIEPVGGWRAG
jgi:hypothetical protein